MKGIGGSNADIASFRRNCLERRSLRLGRAPGTSPSRCMPAVCGTSWCRPPRTSIDLELDRQAQHSRLLSLNDEISRLRQLKNTLEIAKETGDTDVAAWVLEDEEFQNLVKEVFYLFYYINNFSIVNLLIRCFFFRLEIRLLTKRKSNDD